MDSSGSRGRLAGIALAFVLAGTCNLHGEGTKVKSFYGFTLTEAEHDLLQGHEKAFATQEVRIERWEGDFMHLKAGASIALWRDDDKPVRSQESFVVRWMVPKASRARFARVPRLQPHALVFALFVVAKNGQAVTVHPRDAKEFSDPSGSFEVSATDAFRSLRGKGIMYLCLEPKDLVGAFGKFPGQARMGPVRLPSNLLPIEVQFPE